MLIDQLKSDQQVLLTSEKPKRQKYTRTIFFQTIFGDLAMNTLRWCNKQRQNGINNNKNNK